MSPPTAQPAETSPLTAATEAFPAPEPGAVLDSGPKSLLILDTETSGLDPAAHACLEVGAILFDVASRSVLAQQSFLLPVDTNAAEA
ncbi:MAG: 3'-5' exonuclease, partial [Synechococcus sp.]